MPVARRTYDHRLRLAIAMTGDPSLFGMSLPGEVVDRGEYTVTVEGYDGETRIRVTREETLPDEQCVGFKPR